MTGRELYALYRECHGQDTGIRLGPFDEMTHQQRRVWDSLAYEVHDAIMADLRERGIMWEPTS
jgi:hypothetical protein